MESQAKETAGETPKLVEDETKKIAENTANRANDKPERLTLDITSDSPDCRNSTADEEASKECSKEEDKPSTLENSDRLLTTFAPSKRKRSTVDWSSDEEDFAGFEECNGDSNEKLYKRIKEELPSESEQDNDLAKSETASDDGLKSMIKSESKEASNENKQTDIGLVEISEKADVDEKSQAMLPSSAKQRSIKDPIYKKPFAHGWKREVVYRAIPGVSKDKGEVYYISPKGKKIRTRTELQLHLPRELQIENFTFAREAIGMSSEEEMIRVAKPTARTAPTEVTLGKRVPKPKGPKGASPPPQGWTPSRAVKSSTVSSPRTMHTTRVSDEMDNKTHTTPKSTSKSTKSQKKGEPCSIECVLAMGTIPQLQCVKCLCLYHHECIGRDANIGNIEKRRSSGNTSSGSTSGEGGYVCEYCKNKTLPPTQQKSGHQSPSRSNQTEADSVSSTQHQLRESEKSKELQKPQRSGSPAGNKTANNGTKNASNHTNSRTTLPQSIAVIKGRKYVVIRKPSSAGSDNNPKDSTNDQSSISLTTGEDAHLRKRGASARSSKSSENVQLVESSNPPSRSQSTHSENFSTHFFSNVSIGYQILLQTFQYLKVQELLRAACVCRVWNIAANHRSLWRTVRMKNSQINDWTGLAAALKRNGTRHLDLRKMISSTNSEEMWSSFSKNIKEVDSLEVIDLCRCSSHIVEGLFTSNINLKVINAVAIKDDNFNLESVYRLKGLEELRLKSIDGFSLEKDLDGLKLLKNLRHLSLTSVRGLGVKDISVLGSLTSLESLDLGECSDLRVEFATKVLVNLTNLNRLRLEKGQENCCTLDILEAISQLEQLQQLELVNFDIKTGFDEKLSKCKRIRRLLLIPTYISQSATTNNIVLSAVLNLTDSLQSLTWVVTLELLRVTALYVDQCDNKKKDKKFFDESIPVLKPVPGIVDDVDKAQRTASDVPQVEILPLVRVEEILIAGMPNTKFKILKVPYHATWRQNLVDI